MTTTCRKNITVVSQISPVISWPRYIESQSRDCLNAWEKLGSMSPRAGIRMQRLGWAWQRTENSEQVARCAAGPAIYLLPYIQVLKAKFTSIVITCHIKTPHKIQIEAEAADNGEAAPEAGTRPVWAMTCIHGVVSSISIYNIGDSPGDEG
ncbi:hypothetical protein FB451DRAFT_1190013 [Mycena latifolia]|nr:hypothetical protein FB451DRAFT_1190013 [Mycena latifolia]